VGGTWTEVQKLLASNGSAFDNFGVQVAAQGDLAVVGAHDADGIDLATGAVYLFQDMGGIWVEAAKLAANEAVLDDDLGVGVAIDGDTLVAGAPYTDSADVDAGAAYAFSISGATCPTFSGNRPTLSVSSGGTQMLSLDAGPALANALYWVVGSFGGTCPGFAAFGQRFPVNADWYFAYTLLEFAGSPIVNGMGVLDGSGRAQVQVVVPPGTDMSLVGLTVNHAFAGFTLGPLQLLEVSNPVPLTLVL
jgi:hypothetical protein